MKKTLSKYPLGTLLGGLCHVKFAQARIRYIRCEHYFAAILVDLACIFLTVALAIQPASTLISPIISPLHPISQTKSGYEVFGFAPHWTFNRLDNVNWDVLTTLAFFDIPISAEGNVQRESQGYKTFQSDEATRVFKKAHVHGTRVVATFTQLDNKTILNFLDKPQAQDRALDEAIKLVKNRGIDGANLDFEYVGDPGRDYQNKFTQFVQKFTKQMHEQVAGSRVTVSVYASAAINPKLYDIASLGKGADGVFMMAYDFAVHGAKQAMPTSPLYGYETGRYWYDISTAVQDFLVQMPPGKLILGLPWYGYDYPVYQPGIKAETHKGYYTYHKKGRKTYRVYHRPKSSAQTYSIVQKDIKNTTPGITKVATGWDDQGKVGYKAYFSQLDNSWRMIFQDDERSLGIKYSFAKQQGLGGVGIWALGFDEGRTELWDQLAVEFATAQLAKKR